MLSQSEMVNLLIDVHLLEAKVQKLYLTKDSAVQVYNYFEKKLLEQHDVNDSVYNLSLNFYLKEIGEFKTIYDQVVDSLLARQVAKDMKFSVDSTRGLKNVKDSIEVESDSPLEYEAVEIVDFGLEENEDDDNISEGDRR
ncbi:MAG: DUF4296 domain-containing protein [Cyclobacteriaceae bacterium]